jgi:hypothetical protein
MMGEQYDIHTALPISSVGDAMITTDQNQVKRIQSLTETLSDALTIPQVAEVVISQVLAVSRARAGALLLIDSNSALQVIHAVGYKPEVLNNRQRFPHAIQLSVADAVRTAQPIWHTPGETSPFSAVPVIVNGQAIGGIGLDFSDAPALSTADQVFIVLLAQVCGQAIDRARLYEAESIARVGGSNSGSTGFPGSDKHCTGGGP